MFKKVLSMILLSVMIFTTLSSAAQITFTDVEDHWAKKEIYAMAEKWIILGRGDGTFGPNDNITKSHAFLMFSRLMGFYDIENTEIIETGIQEFSEKLKEAGITQAIKELCFLIKAEVISEDYIIQVLGNNQENEELTRLEAAVIFVKLLADEENLSNHPIVLFDDSNLIPKEYIPYVEYVNKIGLMIGLDDNTFNPNGSVTRAQIATILYRIDNIIYERETSKKIGIVESIDLENLIIVIDANGIDSQYQLSKNLKLYNEEKLINKEHLKVNDNITAYFEDELIEKIVINNTEKSIYGKVNEITTEGYISININNTLLSYEIAKNVEVLKEDVQSSINLVQKGQDVRIDLLNNRVIKIVIGEVNYTVSGVIEEITIGKESYITIRNINDEVKKYKTTENMIVDYDGVEAGIYDLRLNMEVKLNISQDGIKKVIIETITNIEIIDGVVEKVLPNIYVFTMRLDNDNVMMIFLDEEETIIKTSSGAIKNIDSIQENDIVSVYGRFEGEVFYPIQVIIQK